MSAPVSKVDEAWANLEPHCAEIAKSTLTIDAANQLIFLSAATSFKRIADAQERMAKAYQTCMDGSMQFNNRTR